MCGRAACGEHLFRSWSFLRTSIFVACIPLLGLKLKDQHSPAIKAALMLTPSEGSMSLD